MPHPFYDFDTYPWHLPEARTFHKTLYDAITTHGQIDLIRRACGPGVGPFAPGNPLEMWKAVLDAIAVAGCLRQLDEHLRTLAAPAVVKALDALREVIEQPIEPGAGDVIFVNRVKLRSALRQLAASNTPKQILVVRGETKSGKSWTQHIITQYTLSFGQDCTYLGEGLVTTVDEALTSIFAPFGGEAPPKGLTTDDAWFRKAASDLLKLAEQRKKGTWIVMDDLGPGPDGVPLLDPLIRRLFDQFALSMKNPAFAKWFRLVLIAYPEGPLPPWKPYALEDKTAVADMQQAALAEFLSKWAKFNSKSLDDSNALQLATKVLATAGAPPAPGDTRAHLQRVHDELEQLLGTL